MTSAEILTQNNIRPSLTRVLIYDYLRQHRTHPTAEEIYTALAPQIPTLSKTTVYNTVKLLTAAGIIKMITIEEQQARFDACTDLHGHFLCTQCGRVYDFDASLPADKLPAGFKTVTREVYYTGTCPDCCPEKCLQ